MGILIVIIFMIIFIVLIMKCALLNEEKELVKDDVHKAYLQLTSMIKKYTANKYHYINDNTHYAIFNNHICILAERDEEETLTLVAKGQLSIEKIIEEQKYDIDKIKYYQLMGSVYQKQFISGGGGGGSSVKGAVIGGLVAGNTGAIIGSREKINEINTTYTEEDDRRVVIVFKDDEEVKLPYQFYDRLLDYVPEKDYDNYIKSKKEKRRKK